MNNIIETELSNGFKKLKPEKGFRLYNKVVKQIYSVAIVKDTNDYIAIRDGENPFEETQQNFDIQGNNVEDAMQNNAINIPQEKEEDSESKYNFGKSDEGNEESDIILDMDENE